MYGWFAHIVWLFAAGTVIGAGKLLECTYYLSVLDWVVEHQLEPASPDGCLSAAACRQAPRWAGPAREPTPAGDREIPPSVGTRYGARQALAGFRNLPGA